MADAVIARSYVELLPRAINFGRQVGATVSQQLGKATSQITAANNKMVQGTTQAAQKSAQNMGKASRQAADENQRQTLRISEAWKQTADKTQRHALRTGQAWQKTTKDTERHAATATARISKRFGGMTASVGQSFKGLGATVAAGLGIAAAGSFLKGAISAASDLNETISKTGTIFGQDALPGLQKWASGAAQAFGQSQQEALDAASTFALFGKSAGLSGQAVVGFSTRTTELASDMASFFNTSPEDAVQAIGAAFRGESEPIRRYNVLLDDASLRNEAVRQGLIKTTKTALTPQQRVLAVQALILRQTTAAQGDFARTSGGLANQQRILSKEFANAKVALGTVFLPVALAVVGFLNKRGIPAFKTLVTGIRAMVAAFQDPDVTSNGFVGFMERVGGAARVAFDYFRANVLPRLKEFAGFVKAQVIPALAAFVTWLVTRLVPGVARIVAALVTSFWPALKTIAGFIASEVIPRIRDFAAFMGTEVIPRILEIGRKIAAAKDFIVPFVATLVAAKVALAGWSVISRVVTLIKLWRNGQIALNIALFANPIGLVVLAVAALVGGLIFAWKHSLKARIIMTTAFAGIGDAAIGMAKVVLLGFKFMVEAALDAAHVLLSIAAKIPGPQQEAMKKALTAFDGFRAGVSTTIDAAGRKLDQWGDKLAAMPKIVKLEGDVDDLTDKLAEVNKQLKSPVLTKEYRAKLTADIRDHKAKLKAVNAALKNPALTAERRARLTAEKKVLDAKLAAALKQLKNPQLTKERTAKLNADKRALEQKLREAQAQINGLKGKTVLVKYTSLGVTTWSPTMTAKNTATGGPIRGPGGPTADRVPIMASNNEHMWTAKEVSAAGGHAAVKSMRNAVLAGRGFAAGGPVNVNLIKQGVFRTIAEGKGFLTRAFGGGDAGPPGSRVRFRGVTLNQRTIRMLLNAERILGAVFHITQGSYSTRVKASGGTHAGGGAMDTNGPRGWNTAVAALRKAGFAAWHRTPAQGPWNHHIHSIAMGDPTASPAAKAQMRSFRAGRNGLGDLSGAAGGAWKLLRDQMLMVHRGEMVVPRPEAEELRRLYGSSGRAAGPPGTGGRGGVTVVRLSDEDRMLLREVGNPVVEMDGNVLNNTMSRRSLRGGYGRRG